MMNIFKSKLELQNTIDKLTLELDNFRIENKKLINDLEARRQYNNYENFLKISQGQEIDSLKLEGRRLDLKVKEVEKENIDLRIKIIELLNQIENK